VTEPREPRDHKLTNIFTPAELEQLRAIAASDDPEAEFVAVEWMNDHPSFGV